MASQAFDRLYLSSDIPMPTRKSAILKQFPQSARRSDEFPRYRLRSPRLVVAFAGGMDSERTAALFEQVFSNWSVPHQKTQLDLPSWQPHGEDLREHITIPEKSQSDLIIGTSAPAAMSEDYQVCSLGNNILGQFGMMGRIGESVRERSGLAYYAGSSLEVGLGPSCWKVTAGVNPDNLDKALSKIKEELRRFISEPVTQAELSDVKQQALGHLPLSLESNVGIVRFLLSLQRYNLSLDYLRDHAPPYWKQ